MIARELAIALDCAESTVSRLLSGDRRPSVETMQDLKLVLNWSMDSQADALERGDYPAQLKVKMERLPAPC